MNSQEMYDQLTKRMKQLEEFFNSISKAEKIITLETLDKILIELQKEYLQQVILCNQAMDLCKEQISWNPYSYECGVLDSLYSTMELITKIKEKS